LFAVKFTARAKWRSDAKIVSLCVVDSLEPRSVVTEMQIKRPLLLGWLAVLVIGLFSPFIVSGTSPLQPSPRRELERFGPAPLIQLQDQSGADFDSRSLQNKVWVVNFFFASCEGVCPALNGRIASVYRNFADNPNVHFVSISVDPEHDSPMVLAEYAKRLKADPTKWSFLMGPTERIREILELGFKLVAPEDKNLHTTRVTLIDQKGEIRGFYQGTEDSLVKMLSDDISVLLAKAG
jgi:protein SCO1/2